MPDNTLIADIISHIVGAGERVEKQTALTAIVLSYLTCVDGCASRPL